MIRAAFVYPRRAGAWLGGVNYLRNLTGALAATPDCGVRPVLLLAPKTPLPEGFEGVEVIRSGPLALRQHLLGELAVRLLGSDPLLASVLSRHRLDLLSHSGVLGRRARIPAIAWFADFQHRVHPEFFDRREVAGRDALFASFVREASLIAVSSESARGDAARFFPEALPKLRTLRFIDCSQAGDAASREELEARHGIAGPYLALPNQYWVHKNHAAVIEALGLLQRTNRKVVVVSTGSALDYRHPGHFERLMKRRAELGLEDAYRVLGVVPFRDLRGLLRNAVAVINPSLFEGWSTSVEEAKSLGKRVLLSAIPVHREQAPQRGVYFDPHRPEEIAEAMWAAWTAHDAAEDEAAAARAALELPGRRSRFAAEYAAIAREAAARRS